MVILVALSFYYCNVSW